MKTIRSQNLFAIVLLAALAFTTTIVRAQEPLPSSRIARALGY
jgi:hypothetical protein